jgi:hypothetical protein
MKTLCVVVKELGQSYQTFIPLISKPIMKHKIQYPEYDALISKILRQQTLSKEEGNVCVCLFVLFGLF